NKRLSSDDYTLYRDEIRKTGRPMILSISDFGSGAWAWDGEKIGQLWRTSYDIYPNMDSVYNCAETSAGDHVTHPAFNGLGQFAGPGHWNDPDMLQVGNLKSDTESRAHFSLWCILAAPLMAGNDLRKMPESVRVILTAKEAIAVNQDPRGIQGYKVFKNDGQEVYNKPLADGTTALLILNKSNKPATIMVPWSLVGLSGRQRVRDLWLRKDIGTFDGSFTSPRLAQHEHLLLKIGSRGRPLPAPAPLPLERYTITKTGVTYLSDLCYIWRRSNPPVNDQSAKHEPLVLGGNFYRKGLGCQGKSVAMYKLGGRASRFQATVGLDPSNSSTAEGRFRVMEEDFFGNKALFDSGKLRPDASPVIIDIDVSKKGCIMLEFTGDNVLGTWGEARVVV
uniref:NPCBM/NEW2 domain-containing protein n=1 Tax=Armatimonas sp. TaxID=1872638 RepID=UPI00286B2EE4